MKLGFFVDQIFSRDNSHISTNESYILFVASLTDHGDQVALIGREAPEPCSGPFKIPQERLSFLSLPYYSSVHDLWRMPRVFSHARQLLDDNWRNWDALAVCGPHPVGNALARAAIKRGLPVIFIVRQNLTGQLLAHGLKGAVSTGIAMMFEQDFRRLARKRPVLAVGMEMTEAYGRADARASSHFPCLIDDERYRELSHIQPEHGSRRLICVGRLSPEKGHRFLFAALRELASMGVACNADIVGDGPLEQELIAMAAAMGIADRVTFHGYVPYGDELFGLYRNAGALVLPSLTEGFPQVINEAMCIGLPVIASGVGGIPAFVRHGETGLLTKARDVNGLKEAILQILQDRSLWLALSHNGRAAMAGNTLGPNRNHVLKVIHDEVELMASAAA